MGLEARKKKKKRTFSRLSFPPLLPAGLPSSRITVAGRIKPSRQWQWLKAHALVATGHLT